MAALLAFGLGAAAARPPNVILLMTDDQDLRLGSLQAMPKLHSVWTRPPPRNPLLCAQCVSSPSPRQWVTARGAFLPNYYVATPKCCPSRAELLTSRYEHAVRVDDRAAQGCMRVNVSLADNPGFYNKSWVRSLHAAGYRTGAFGKFSNAMAEMCPPPKAPPHAPGSGYFIPPGWTDFFVMCPNDRVHTDGATLCYTNCTWAANGTILQTNDGPTDYATSIIGNHSLAFVQNAVAAAKPFFAYITPHAPHAPATPAVWYEGAFPGEHHAPRTPNWNYTSPKHHWMIRNEPGLTPENVANLDLEYIKRWRTLLSVDDIVDAIFSFLDSAGELNNTYFIYTSDNGYQLGQFRIPAG